MYVGLNIKLSAVQYIILFFLGYEDNSITNFKAKLHELHNCVSKIQVTRQVKNHVAILPTSHRNNTSCLKHQVYPALRFAHTSRKRNALNILAHTLLLHN